MEMTETKAKNVIRYYCQKYQWIFKVGLACTFNDLFALKSSISLRIC